RGALQIPRAPLRRRRRDDVCADRRSSRLLAAAACSYLSGVVDAGGERGGGAACRCLDARWQDGLTEPSIEDRYLHAHVQRQNGASPVLLRSDALLVTR